MGVFTVCVCNSVHRQVAHWAVWMFIVWVMTCLPAAHTFAPSAELHTVLCVHVCVCQQKVTGKPKGVSKEENEERVEEKK